MAYPGSGTIRVFIVDDHSIVRHGLTSYLGVTGDIEVAGEAADGDEAVRAIAELAAAGCGPDVALVDLVMPGLDGVGVAQALRRLAEPPRVLILSSFGDVEHLRSALRAGVSGYVLKSASAEEIAAAVREVNSGRLHLDAGLSASLTEAVAPSGIAVSLTGREGEVVALVAKGKSNKDIAAALVISERTARTHVSHLLGKLGLESRMQLAIWAHNATGGGGGPFCEPIDVGVWESAMAATVYSILHGLNAFLPRMLSQGEGHIVNTASRQGLVPSPILGAYPPAKSAVITLSEMLHAELAERGSPVGVTVLTPGGVKTEGILASLALYESGQQDDPAMHEFLASRVAAAVDPLDLGRLVVRAVQTRTLYVNTHRETLKWLQERVDRIVADADRIGTLR